VDLLERFIRVRIPGDAGTLTGFREWLQSDDCPERGLVALINGNILIDMSPVELETHSKVIGAIFSVVSTLVEEADLGECHGDGVSISNSRAKLSTVPDSSFIKWSTWESGRAQLVPRRRRPGQFIEIHGTPDWVLEVVSDWSVQKDTVELPIQYHRAGIPEFWLIDARGGEIDFQILVRRPKKYKRSEVRGDWSFSPTFDRWFRLVRRPNRAGRWSYQLELKID
jgi:Uma2 family endonuclease